MQWPAAGVNLVDFKSSYWRETMRGTSFLDKKGSNGLLQAKVWWIKYVAARGKI